MRKISLYLFLLGCGCLYGQTYININTTSVDKYALVSDIKNATFNSTEMIFELNSGTIATENLADIIKITFGDEPLGDQALPVELLSFNAISGNNQVILTWSTASEINNYAFIIERSLDNDNFEVIAEIEGQGSVSHQTDYTFIDKLVLNGITYYYRLADRNINGAITYHTVVNATPNYKEVDKFSLYNNYPNPFNPETTIKFDIPTINNTLSHIKLGIYNSLGQLVSNLYEGSISGGSYEVKWNAGNLSSGIYYISFQSNDYNKTQKMILMK